MRCHVTYTYLLAQLHAEPYATSYHYHPVEVPGGYKLSACIQPVKMNTKVRFRRPDLTHKPILRQGVAMPTRYFATCDYLPITLDEGWFAEFGIRCSTNAKPLTGARCR